ncbi:hypothetical protein DFJ73DRAFT_827486 [Zopfochytrium polystomum]|nr:hypothetical protein DFJ73DRAFT_827486 [Zopfochytrium polystomum]
MGVLSKASLAFAFDGLADTLVPIESTSYRRAVAKSGLFMGGVQPFSEKNAVLPVFEFVEARRSAISFNAGRQAYEAAFSGDYSGAEHSYVRGKVVMQIEAGKMGKPTVKAVKLSVRLLRLEPSSIGVGELLFEKELWKANSPTGFEELDGTMEYSFSIPIHPNLAASFAELPVLSSASEGASNLKGASYNLMAVLTRPSMPDIETTYPVLLRNAVPPHYIREERVSVHKGSLGPGTRRLPHELWSPSVTRDQRKAILQDHHSTRCPRIRLRHIPLPVSVVFETKGRTRWHAPHQRRHQSQDQTRKGHRGG